MSSPSAETPLLGGISTPPPSPTTPFSNQPAQNDISSASERASTAPLGISPAISRRLFISHFLSTWNSRVFEFGAVLFLASIFPKTLLPMSVYALTRGASAIAFSPAVGRYIDTGNRLQVVRLSIGMSPPLPTLSAHHTESVPGCSCTANRRGSIMRYILVPSHRVAHDVDNQDNHSYTPCHFCLCREAVFYYEPGVSRTGLGRICCTLIE
jgi:hypothetical protein